MTAIVFRLDEIAPGFEASFEQVFLLGHAPATELKDAVVSFTEGETPDFVTLGLELYHIDERGDAFLIVDGIVAAVAGPGFRLGPGRGTQGYLNPIWLKVTLLTETATADAVRQMVMTLVFASPFKEIVTINPETEGD